MASIEKEIKQEVFRDSLSKAIVNLIYTHNYLQAHLAEIFKPYGLTSPQYNILRILRGQYPKNSTINLLIDRMLDKSSNASRIVDKLELKGYVSRKQCPSDRRSVDVLITQKGLDLLSKIDIEMDKWHAKNTSISHQEAELLNTLLDKIRFD